MGCSHLWAFFALPTAADDVCLSVCFHLAALGCSFAALVLGHDYDIDHHIDMFVQAGELGQAERTGLDIGHCTAGCVGRDPGTADSAIVLAEGIAGCHSHHIHCDSHCSDWGSSEEVEGAVGAVVEEEVLVVEKFSGRFYDHTGIAAEVEAAAIADGIRCEPCFSTVVIELEPARACFDRRSCLADLVII